MVTNGGFATNASCCRSRKSALRRRSPPTAAPRQASSTCSRQGVTKSTCVCSHCSSRWIPRVCGRSSTFLSPTTLPVRPGASIDPRISHETAYIRACPHCRPHRRRGWLCALSSRHVKRHGDGRHEDRCGDKCRTGERARAESRRRGSQNEKESPLLA